MAGNVWEWCADVRASIPLNRRRILAARERPPAGCPAAAVGRTSPRAAGRRFATRASRRTATTTWAFAWPQFRPAQVQDQSRPVRAERSLERRPRGDVRSEAEPLAPRAGAEGGAEPGVRAGAGSSVQSYILDPVSCRDDRV